MYDSDDNEDDIGVAVDKYIKDDEDDGLIIMIIMVMIKYAINDNDDVVV